MNLVSLKRKFFSLWQAPADTGQTAVRSGFLIFLNRIFIKGIYFIKTIILARLLFPEHFGTFGLATVSLGFINTFFQTGFQSAIIQEKEEVEKHLDSAWTVNLIRSFLIAAILYLAAPWFAVFFNNYEITPFIRVLSLTSILEGLENVGAILWQRKLEFRKKFFFDMSMAISEVVVVVLTAWYWRNPWALVAGAFASKISAVAFSYILHPYRPKLTLDFSGAKHLFKYGKWIGLTGIISFLVSQGDYIIIGKLLGAKSLGFYQLAFSLGIMPAVELSRVLGTLLFPLFAKIQKDLQLLRRVFVKISALIFCVTIPASLGLMALNTDIVGFIYGEKWLPMAPILSVVILLGLLKSFEYIVTPLFLGVGRPKIPTVALVVQSLVMFSFIWPLTNEMGAVGTAWAVVAGSLAAQIILLFILRGQINLGFRGVVKNFFIPAISGLLMFCSIRALKEFFNFNFYYSVFLYIVFGFSVYILLLFLFDKIFGKKIYNDLLWIKKKI